MDIAKIKSALCRTSSRRVAVFGDYCLDKYLYSDPAEDDVSVETGQPAWQIYKKRMSAGAAGTITNNLRALGAEVYCAGAVGDDGEGFELLKALREVGANTDFMSVDGGVCTATYMKSLRRTPDGGWREDLRLDLRNRAFGGGALREKLVENLRGALELCDAAIISDQFFERNTGAVSDEVRAALNSLAESRPDKLILVDSRSFASEYRNMYVKCNNFELMKYCGMTGSPESVDDIVRCGTRLRELTGKPVFITRNSSGIAVFDDRVSFIPTYIPQGEIDVTGAGDASNAAIALSLSLGLSCEEAAVVACAVSSVTIEQLGTTGTCSPEQASSRAESIFKSKVKRVENF